MQDELSVAPSDVSMSMVDSLVLVNGRTLTDNMLHPLTPLQLSEVAAVYNAWRVGNLQDCTLTEGARIKWA